LTLTEDIDTRLEYFQELEHATRMLNHPGESLVLQTDFLYMVERVDICIDYLKAHVSVLMLVTSPRQRRDQRHFREAEIYLLRFQPCMTRAMTLIKMYFVGSLRALTTDISKRLSEKVGHSLLAADGGSISHSGCIHHGPNPPPLYKVQKYIFAASTITRRARTTSARSS
jgi:Sec34-like family